MISPNFIQCIQIEYIHLENINNKIMIFTKAIDPITANPVQYTDVEYLQIETQEVAIASSTAILS